MNGQNIKPIENGWCLKMRATQKIVQRMCRNVFGIAMHDPNHKND